MADEIYHHQKAERHTGHRRQYRAEFKSPVLLSMYDEVLSQLDRATGRP